MEVAMKEPLNTAEERERIAPTGRFTAPDVARVIACACVPSLHFLLHSGFYSLPVTDAPTFIMLGMRTVFMCSVPLFVLLTGWLMANKTPSRAYYAKGNKTLFSILLLGCYSKIQFFDCNDLFSDFLFSCRIYVTYRR